VEVPHIDENQIHTGPNLGVAAARLSTFDI